MVGFNFAPRAWALCNGQLLPINQNSALFSLLGTTYGGDGRTTFALPDLRGRAPVHAGDGTGLAPKQRGESRGVEHIQLIASQMPSHNHTAATHVTTAFLVGVDDEGSQTDASGHALANSAGDAHYHTSTPSSTMSAASITANAATMVYNYGSSQEHDNMQPYLAINFVIALQGIYPSRS